MSTRDTEERLAQAAPPDDGPAQDIRIDAPHLVDAKRSVPSEPSASAIGGLAPAAQATRSTPTAAELLEAQQLYNQAAQLAGQLRVRQDNLDHREAQLNAGLAKLEQGQRAARLWLSEREGELAELRAALEAQEQEAARRIDRLAAAEAALQRKASSSEDDSAGREQSLRARQAELEAGQRLLAQQIASLTSQRQEWEAKREQAEDAIRRERQEIDAQRESSLEVVRLALAGLEQRRLAIETEAEKLERRAGQPDPAHVAREEELRRREAVFRAKWRQLEESEHRLAESRAQVDRLTEQLRRQQQQMREAVRAQRLQIANEQRLAQADLDRQREAVHRRSEQVDQCRAGVEQLRKELGQVHRDTLEMRLATEELWARLSATASPAAVSRTLAEIRAKLRQDYRDAGEELRREKEALEAVRGQLTEQHERLVKQKHDFERWAEAERRDIERMAQSLFTREQELHEQETLLAEHVRRWQGERVAIQEELRRLRARVGEAGEALAPA